jgi:hypothetical protein
MNATRRLVAIAATALVGWCAVVPGGHAIAKCASGGYEREERVYELVEIQAVDGGTVPETVRARWAEGARVTADTEGVGLGVLAIDDDVHLDASPEAGA